MSTNETDLEQRSAEDLSTEELLKELKGNQETQPETPQEHEIRLATGQVYKGKTYEEAVEKLKAAQEEASRTIREREWTIKELKERSAPKAASVTVGNEGGGYDHNAYLELLAQDAVKAQDYLYRTAYGIDDPRRFFQEVKTRAQQQAEVTEYAMFNREVPDYPSTPENNMAMEQYLVSQGIEKPTKNDLKLAYYELREQGVIQAPVTEKPRSRGARAMPTIGNTRQEEAGTPEDLEEMLMSMPKDKFDEFIAKKGLKRG